MSATTLQDLGGNLKQHFAMPVGAALGAKSKGKPPASAAKPPFFKKAAPAAKLSRQEKIANDLKGRNKGEK